MAAFFQTKQIQLKWKWSGKMSYSSHSPSYDFRNDLAVFWDRFTPDFKLEGKLTRRLLLWNHFLLVVRLFIRLHESVDTFLHSYLFWFDWYWWLWNVWLGPVQSARPCVRPKGSLLVSMRPWVGWVPVEHDAHVVIGIRVTDFRGAWEPKYDKTMRLHPLSGALMSCSWCWNAYTDSL